MEDYGGDGGFGVHHEAIGEVYAGVGFRFEEFEQDFLVGQVRAYRVAERVALAAVFTAQQRRHRGFGYAPSLADAVMDNIGESLGQHQGQRLHQVGLHVVASLFFPLRQLQHALAAGDGEQRYVVLPANRSREIGQAKFLPALLPREVEDGRLAPCPVVENNTVGFTAHREEPVDAARLYQLTGDDLPLYPVHQFPGLPLFFRVALLELQEAEVEQTLVHVLEQLLQPGLGVMPLQVRGDRDVVRVEVPAHYLAAPARSI